MADVLSPITVSPPPSPSSPSKSNILMLYYGLTVVGTAAIALALYNYIVIKRCNRRHMHQPHPQRPNGLVQVVVERSMSYENSQRNLLSSFKYKKEQSKKEGAGGKDHHNEEDGDDYYYECPVCLSVFEEGEEVRKLPRCKHSFHVQCIDMWLYSHFDCPVCRTPVGPFCRHVLPENPGGRLPESEGNGAAGVGV